MFYSDTYLLTPWCRVLPEQLNGLQLVKKFPTFHGTWRFITALTSVRHLSLSWASPIQSTYPHPTSWRSILILSTHLRLGLLSGLFPSSFPTKTLYTPLSQTLRAGKPQLEVNEYGVGSWDFILHSSMKFPLCFHLQTVSGGTHCPTPWALCQVDETQRKLSSFSHWRGHVQSFKNSGTLEILHSETFRLLQQHTQQYLNHLVHSLLSDCYNNTQSGAQLVNHVSYMFLP